VKIIIAAMSRNRVIGKDNSIPWIIPEDLKYFKKVTSNSSIVMGRRTFESIGKSLPDRENIVLTKQAELHFKDIIIAPSLQDAFELATNKRIFIIGGASVYKEALPLVNKMYLTFIDHYFEGDTFFPYFDKNKWDMSIKKEVKKDAKHQYAYMFSVFTRKKVIRCKNQLKERTADKLNTGNGIELFV